MTYSMNSENKLDGASNFRAWKTRIDLILSKNKVLDILKGNIVEPVFEEGKEKEPQNVVVMEKFKDSEINAMSIIVDSIKDHLIPYISHLDSSKKMYDALTNLFSVRNIRQVMSVKNELRDMKMNDDDSITSYFVRISQLRDQLQAIEEIISEKELVNMVLNGLPKTWDAFAASMNTRKEYPAFEELWTLVLKKNQGSVQKRNPKISTMITPSRQDSRTSGTKGSLAQGGSQIKRKTFHKYNASTVESIVTTRIIVSS
jgi:putative lipoic acid-binding regulatory protein